jgi:hypothetical protein
MAKHCVVNRDRNMIASSIRTIAGSVAAAVAVLASPLASAELSRHLPVASLVPIGNDFEVPTDPSEIDFDIRFGEAVAIRDGIAFAGIPGSHDGRVAVFNQAATGWQRVQTLTAPTPVSRDEFGRALAFRDGFAFVGSKTATYIFKRSNGVWRHFQTLKPPAADGAGRFPVALRYEAGTLLASADRGSALPNFVYVFERDASGKFVQRAKLRALDAAGDDNFGASLGVTGTALVIGSPGGDDQRSFNVPGFSGPGAAYVFRRNSVGNWVQTQKLTAVDDPSSFGAAVAIDNAMIIVGAPKFDTVGGVNGPEANAAGGAAYGFVPVAGRYVETFKLRPSADEKSQYQAFGYEIAMFGRNIAIAATEPYGAVSAFPRGFIFTYDRVGSTLTARGVAASHIVSSSMGLSNNLLMAGDPGDVTCPFGCSGHATVYDVLRFFP